MRRWNGWGEETVTYPLHAAAWQFLEELVGRGTPPRDATWAEALASVPASRLGAVPLIDREPAARLRHARGHSLPDWVAMRSGEIPAFPDGVTYPATAEQVRDRIAYAVTAGIRLIPYGGGTSVVGHVNPEPGEAPVLTVDLSRLSGLLRLDETSQLATFGAGTIGPDLEAQLRARGYTLGHFPQSFEYSTLGGWIVTRSSGQQSLGYGRIERLFAGGRLEAPAGRLDLPAFPASAAGPDLRELVCGSEGRMGILTEATVRISRLPEREAFHAVFFPGFEQGCAAAREIVQARLPLSLLRLSTSTETDTTLALAGHERLLGMLQRYLGLRGAAEGKCMLMVGFSGLQAAVDMARSEVLGISARHGGVHVGQTFGKQWHRSRFRTPYLRNSLWELGYAIDTLETATDWANVPVLIEAIESALRKALEPLDERIHAFTHLSHLYPYGSNIYTTVLFRAAATPDRMEAAAETVRRWRLLKAAASQAIVTHGGTISHQHGVGVDHLPYVEREKGALGMAALRDFCARFDPDGIMNPGKLLPEGEVRD